MSLTQTAREDLLRFLSDADEDIIVSAMHAHIDRKYPRATKSVAPNSVSTPATADVPENDEPAVIPRVQVPPGEACSRVGADTKAAILRYLGDGGATAIQINSGIKRGAAQLEATESILKLLWVRGDIVFADDLYRVK